MITVFVSDIEWKNYNKGFERPAELVIKAEANNVDEAIGMLEDYYDCRIVDCSCKVLRQGNFPPDIDISEALYLYDDDEEED